MFGRDERPGFGSTGLEDRRGGKHLVQDVNMVGIHVQYNTIYNKYIYISTVEHTHTHNIYIYIYIIYTYYIMFSKNVYITLYFHILTVMTEQVDTEIP